MGDFGAKAILAELAARGRSGGGPVRALTHCNTGSLATAAYGTALGVVRALAQRGALEHAFCTETRPYNQGATLQRCQPLSRPRLTGPTPRLCRLLTATRHAGALHCLLRHRNRLIIFAIRPRASGSCGSVHKLAHYSCMMLLQRQPAGDTGGEQRGSTAAGEDV